MWRCLWTFLAILAWVSGEYLMGGHLDNNAGVKLQSESLSTSLGNLEDLEPSLAAEESTISAIANTSSTLIDDNDDDDDDDVARYRLPYPFTFNGGKPFSLEKDPITGKIDFEKATPVKVVDYTDNYAERRKTEGSESDVEEIRDEGENVRDKYKDDRDRVSSNEINKQQQHASNFHDFLNLPVHYSADRYGNDKYPLISSSYANTKVQSGTNNYSVYNHRPDHSDSDFHAPHSVQDSYAPVTRTGVHKTAINHFKTRWENPPLATTTSSIATATPSKVLYAWSSGEPVATTRKPPPAPSVTSTSNDRTTEGGDEKNLPPMKISQNANVSAQSQSDKTNYKGQPSLDNFVLPHAGVEVKTQAEQDEEYRDSYDMYESLGDEENGEDDNDSYNNDRDANGKVEESDYFLPFHDTLKEAFDAIPLTIATTASAVNATTTPAAVPVASTESASPSVTSIRKDTLATVPQNPVASSSSLSLPNDDRARNATERRNATTHEYRPASTIKSELSKIGTRIAVESASNVVIPPDRNTVSFVLGNHQSVNGDRYSAVVENPGGFLDIGTTSRPLRNNPYGPAKEIKHEHSSISITEPEDGSDRATQKWWPPGSGALKSGGNEFEPTRYQSPFAVASNEATESTQSQGGDRDSVYITFPNEAKDRDAIAKERIVVKDEIDDEPPPPSSSKGTSTTKLGLPTSAVGGDSLPQLAENLMPPAESSVPPYYYHYQHNVAPLRPDHPKPQRLPPQPPGLLAPPLDVAGLRRHSYSPDAKLPNILPQFRPNTKASHGHRPGSEVVGTMLAGQGLPARTKPPQSPSRSPFPPSFLHLQRLTPPPPPIHAVKLSFVPTSKMDSVAPPHETKTAIRKFHPPSSPITRADHLREGASNRLFDREPEDEGRRQNRDKGEFVGENQSLERYLEESSITPPRPPLFPRRKTVDLPAITTLQMIQQHGGEFGDNEVQFAQPVAEPVLAEQPKHRKPYDDRFDSRTEADDERPVYVVYPVNTAVNIHPDDSNERDGSVVIGTRGPHRPLPPDTLLQDERNKIHTGRPVAPDFPYPLERSDVLPSLFPATVKETPLLIPSDQRRQQQQQQQQQQQTSTALQAESDENKDAINVIPYLQDYLPHRQNKDDVISVTLQRATPSPPSTSTPLAYVYTPLHSTHRVDGDVDVDVTSIDEAPTVLLPSQQPSGSSGSAPAPQNFMAPFIASINAETPTKNDWSVIVDPSLETDRKPTDDSDEGKPISAEVETERNEFDSDNFKPQLFGGFQPIYEFFNQDIEHPRATDANTETDTKKLPDQG